MRGEEEEEKFREGIDKIILLPKQTSRRFRIPFDRRFARLVVVRPRIPSRMEDGFVDE